MEDLSLHILDIVENSITAEARLIEINIVEDLEKDLITIELTDDGKGMDQQMLQKVLDPFVTTRTTRRVGLGLPLFAEAARMSNGQFDIQSKVGQGTKVKATFQASHIDCKPMGDIVGTIVTLIAGNPQVDFVYRHRKNDLDFSFDTREIKKALEDVPINTPRVLNWIRENLRDGLAEIGVITR
ncbi:MAG: ATP-binding protein [candidate division KSB1 bacterium]|nr:ATP-binding protein [candidate division KSB1 bacterium]